MKLIQLFSITAVLFLTVGCSNSEQVEKGKALYTTFCVSCHGTDGGLRMAGAPDLAKSKKTSEDKAIFISNGSPKGTMSPFGKENGGSLSKEDIKSVVSYIESFK